MNAKEKDHKFDLSVTGSKLENSGTLWKLTAKSLDAINRAGEPAQVEVKESLVGRVYNAITASPISVTIYRLPIGRQRIPDCLGLASGQ